MLKGAEGERKKQCTLKVVLAHAFLVSHRECAHRARIAKFSYIRLRGHCFLPHCRLRGTVLWEGAVCWGACNCILPSTANFCVLMCP